MKSKSSSPAMNANKGNYVVRKSKGRKNFMPILVCILIIGLVTTVFAIQFKTQFTQHAYFATGSGSCFLSACGKGAPVANGTTVRCCIQTR